MTQRPEHLVRLYEHYGRTRLREARQLAELLGQQRPAGWHKTRVLDVGCGDGAFALAFAECGADVVAFDREPERIRNTRALTAQTSVNILLADAMALPFSAESFDVVLMNDLLEHVDRPAALLVSVGRILRPGGFAFIATTSRSSIVTALNDPHYNLPGISLLPRTVAAWYVTRLTRVSPKYNVGTYFFYSQLRQLIFAAGLYPQEVTKGYENKIRSASFSAAPGRRWLALALRHRTIRSAVIAFAGTWLFRQFIQPGWEFLALKYSANGKISQVPFGGAVPPLGRT
jgi:ubiquinone/menaquinone biosynthesis C-methylase UbiE